MKIGQIKFLILPFLALPFALFAEVSALYLSWYGDPSTTMTIQWHTHELPEDSLSWKATESAEWQELDASHRVLSPSNVFIHQANLSGLEPGIEYQFRIGYDPKIYRFHTMPRTLDRPIQFAIGGDLFLSRKLFRRMAETVRSHHPDFIVIGGDIAYASHRAPFQFRSSAQRRWLAFFKEWKEQFSDGHVTPFLIVPGNHDVSSDNYELFFTFFAFPKEQLYRAVDFGDYLSLFLLDTGHFHPIDGPQAHWLKSALQERVNRPFRLAVYHEGAYPSYYPYLGATPKKIRTFWSPLFEQYGLQAAFEHHNHAFKRTYPLRAGQIDPSGVLYLGDGSWGAPARKTNDLWYLEKKSKRNGVWMIHLTPETASLKAIDLHNETIDEVFLPINAQAK